MYRPCCIFAGVTLLSLATLLLGADGGGGDAAPSPGATQWSGQGPTTQQLQQDLQRILREMRPDPSRRSGALRGTGSSPLLGPRAQELVREILRRLQVQMMTAVEREFGPMAAIQAETIPLEALGPRGRVVEVPVTVKTRALRPLTLPENTAKAFAVMETGDLALSLYDALPASVEPKAREAFRREYVGDDARAVAAEARFVVALKGGEWREPQGSARVANAVAVRGLDLDKGLHSNGNTTYDDTLYVIVDEGGQDTVAYEYRMTTESSSSEAGVGRLNAKQVFYVRGKHRGKDPGYRLETNEAEGTRVGAEGTQQIVGANVHSAYAKRPIDSQTPLKPNVSLGCQVVAASKSDFEQSLVFTLDKKGIRGFPYTIVDGDELAVLDRALAGKGKHSILIHGIPRAAGTD